MVGACRAQLGAVLQTQGLGKGDRVGILALDRLEMIEHWQACLKTGIVRVGINLRYALPEIEQIVRDADLRLLLVQDLIRLDELTGDSEIDRVLISSVGRPLPQVDVEVRDDDDKVVPRGQTGEICVRGPVLAGYLNMPDESARALAGGWFHMGDVGHQDENGRVFLSDRKHFMIISGGYNVFPAVVENVLAEHPAVAEVAVVGAIHPHWGEAVVAVVVSRKDAAGFAPSPAALIDYCASRVVKWEVPKHVELVDALPIGTTGKIQKRAIKEWFEREPGRLPWNHNP